VAENAELGPHKVVRDGVGCLKAQDEVTRNHLLHAADLFLQDENQEADSAPACVGRQTRAA
jgi:hypothetical protein